MIRDPAGKSTLPSIVEVRTGSGQRMRGKGALYEHINKRRHYLDWSGPHWLVYKKI